MTTIFKFTWYVSCTWPDLEAHTRPCARILLVITSFYFKYIFITGFLVNFKGGGKNNCIFSNNFG